MPPRKTAIARLRERALLADPVEIAAFNYDHLDVLVTEAIVRGAKSLADLEEFTGSPIDTLKTRLLDPVRSAWIAGQVSKSVGQRLGLVDGALFHRAITTGDPNAARLLYSQFGKLQAEPTQRRESLDVKIDLSGLSKDELVKFAAEKARQLGLKNETIVEAEAVIKETPPNDE